MMKKLRWILIALIVVVVGITGILFYINTQDEAPRNDDYQFVLITNELDKPVYLTHAGDERLFVVEKVGRIRILENETLLAAPFLDISSQVGSSASEQGLLSMAFAPDYVDTGRFYVYYTDRAGDTVVERYVVSDDPNLAEVGSAELIYATDQPYENHNGGLIKFGRDGYLYIGLGDGGSGGDPQGNGQDLSEPLGSLLRIDVSGDAPYTVPEDNPLVNTPDAAPEIWAYGLRNPWRFSFDRLTGDLYIGDVGQGAWEEINFQPADSPGGENYGWDYYEGTHDFENADQADRSTMTFPVMEYGRNIGVDTRNWNCSVTGGYVYRGTALPELQGKYFYGDWCSGTIWTLTRDGENWVNAEFINSEFNISSFGEDVAGELYLLSFADSVWKLVRNE